MDEQNTMPQKSPEKTNWKEDFLGLLKDISYMLAVVLLLFLFFFRSSRSSFNKVGTMEEP